MCGICCVLYNNEDQALRIETSSFLSSRGPDITGKKTVTIDNNTYLHLQGFVLHLRGEPTQQPLVSDDGDSFLWNGEVFGGLKVTGEENDTQVIFNNLSQCVTDEEVLNIFDMIEGPWAFIYYQHKKKKLWFGRDKFGRRSLLWHLPVDQSDVFSLSSVTMEPYKYFEVPSIGIFCVNLDKSTLNANMTLDVFPWKSVVWPETQDLVENEIFFKSRIYPELHDNITWRIDKGSKLKSWIPSLNKELPPAEFKSVDLNNRSHSEYLKNMLLDDQVVKRASDQLLKILESAVQKRVLNLPKSLNSNAGKLSGGIQGPQTDAVFLEFLKEVTISEQNGQEPCKTGAVRTENSEANVSANSIATLKQLNISDLHKLTDSPSGESCPVSGSIPGISGQSNVPISGQSNVPISGQSNVPISGQSNEPISGQSNEPISGQSNVAILFSGGIDSAIITALVDRCIPSEESIDLLNVAFELQLKSVPNTVKNKKHNLSEEIVDKFKVPDRVTGYTALTELNPNRKWNFIEINVTYEELKTVRNDRVRHLVYPSNTVLDDSIGCALWFAARGQGRLTNGVYKGNPYISKAKVILCGMGADEQLAGYSRHRSRYSEGGWKGLLEEIEMEIQRISARNLGRDDRIIGDHGKEARFPFLDEEVVSYLSSLPIDSKAQLDLPRGLGEKLLLRLSAYQLGLEKTSCFPKRAIQFGSRIAKMENSKEKAGDKCQRLVD